MRNIQTLHCHTTNSDGKLSHLEVLKVCEQYGISTIAFTDHDSLIDQQNLAKLFDYKGPVRWISGIEISSGLPIELGGGAVSNFHIVGLFVDPTNEDLVAHCELAQNARVTRMQTMVNNLKGLGFNISEEDCLVASGGETVGRPHIVTALKTKEENLNIIENLRNNMERDAQNNPELMKKYTAMMERGEQQYPYVLFLSEDSYIPGIYVDYQYFLDMDASVELIRKAGGVAILAHYFTCYKKVDAVMLEGMLRNNRLDGLETVYGFLGDDAGEDIKKEVAGTVDTCEKLVKKYNKLAGGGADAHTERDLIGFSEAIEYAQRTENMVENILSAKNIDTTWSNIK